jgi:hypothetical protein
VAGRLDYETRQWIRREISDTRRARARNANRIEKELENEMTITAQIMCTCGHPHRQHAFGASCTMHGCGCERFTLDEKANGNGHQADGRDALARMDSGEPQRAAKPAERQDKPAEELHCKRPGCTSPLRPGSATRGAWVLCEQHYAEQRTKLSRSQLKSNAERNGDVSTALASEPAARPAELEPAAPPPVEPPAPEPDRLQVSLICLRLGDWELCRNEDGSDCKLYRGNGDVLEELDWQELLRLPALIAAVSQAFEGPRD